MQNYKNKKMYILKNNKSYILNIKNIEKIIIYASKGLNKTININDIIKETINNMYHNMPIEDIYKACILASKSFIEKDPEYSKLSARILLYEIYFKIFKKKIKNIDINLEHIKYFTKYIKLGIKYNLIDKKLKKFNLKKLAHSLKIKRDLQFNYLGLKTLFDRYFLKKNEKILETPQIFFMRVAMGLAINEKNKNYYAIKFYNLLSSFNFITSTPTLFNSGTKKPQLSSCYISTINDNLKEIFNSIKENALLSKYAGGLGNDWTPVRSLGAYIKGINGKSSGIIPFLKIVNDTAIAVSQGGKRKGAVCVYLETWHLDIEEFLELRKNTGDDRRRTHDINTANWIPDLFMKRVIKEKNWTLFSPSDVPDLHEKFGKDFEITYKKYEKQTQTGIIKLFKIVKAKNLWRKMLSMLFETGHPWITFKDTCNIRSQQQHIGIIHSSNLCTEITLNTNSSEIAVCNLGSINLPAHLINNKINHKKLKKTINIAMRMLDNVIDINYYPVNKTKKSNLNHRPVGLGIMGFQDCLYIKKISYASKEAMKFADNLMEIISYYTILASTKLSKEKGFYKSYNGSLWQQGILPIDTILKLKKKRKKFLNVNLSISLDWDNLRKKILKYGMRNSNCLAIAPTSTISNIINVTASIEPNYGNLYTKSNLSGEFIEINEYLVNDLKKLNLWDKQMINDLKYFNGNLKNIKRIPEELKKIYLTCFEIDPSWLIEAASRRQKWIDQSQSLNIYLSYITSGKKLDEIYKLAWLKGLKTTYYLRSLGATHAERSTLKIGELNKVPIYKKCFSKKIETCEACQ
ncbi:ribonucleoside-diphosphate reductase subunit alpha [Candidatus Zinderia endosymbiont of Aphrophora alni]|uniref:ribonucleoside-diphosphate reductase subunit alpha n=1 Tax=Candidatus Zinderia endosymbiont of Aphrophora alni TaxID=3077951 RepID=UPI0030CC3D21